MADFWPTLQKIIKQENPVDNQQQQQHQIYNEPDFISVIRKEEEKSYYIHFLPFRCLKAALMINV